jgi:mRNA interferase RelE/StbE
MSSSVTTSPNAFSSSTSSNWSPRGSPGLTPERAVGLYEMFIAACREKAEEIDGPLATSSHRVGKPLDEPFDGYHSARRGTYRIIYRINEDKHTVEIHSIRHRRDSYRTRPREPSGVREAEADARMSTAPA